LGLSTGLFFWLITFQRLAPSPQLDRLVRFFSDYVVPPVLLEMMGAFAWGILLSRISGYGKWWRLSLAAIVGVRLGNFTLYNGLLPEWVLAQLPTGISTHLQFGIIRAVAVLCVTASTGVLLGLVIGKWKASLLLAASTGLVSVLAALLTLFIMGELGIRVGSGNAAMPKVTAAATMAAALAGGATLGVLFSRYARTGSSQSGMTAE
jgi:hypothetical protein